MLKEINKWFTSTSHCYFMLFHCYFTYCKLQFFMHYYNLFPKKTYLFWIRLVRQHLLLWQCNTSKN